MKTINKIFVALLLVVVSVSFVSAKPRVMILATGGTIAGSAATATQAGYTAGVATVDQLISAVPQMKNLADISGMQISNIGSQEMNDQVWLKLATEINRLFKENKCDAIVITHGTDTMEETAFFLNLVVKSDKPVVLVGAMRPSTALSADGPMNLYKAVVTATTPEAKGKGVMVMMNDYILGADDVTKMNSTNVNAFACPNYGPLGQVIGDNAYFTRVPMTRHTTNSEFSVEGLTKFPTVDILIGYANASALPAKALVDAKVDGIVHAGVGNGNIYPTVMTELDRAVKNGIQVIRASRIPVGMVPMNGEVSDTEHGFTASGFHNAPKSRVLLMMALTKTKDLNEIRRIFEQY
ncbi:MAG: type II asparaginase [Bacteroidales bacterium]